MIAENIDQDIRRLVMKNNRRNVDENGRILMINRIVSSDRHMITEFEAHHHQSLQHENIIKLYRCEEDPNTDLLLFYEYADCGNLHNFLSDVRNQNKYSLKLKWMVQCANALAYLHGREPKIVYNNLKTRHLLICNNYLNIKLCDFSKATSGGDESRDIYPFGILLWRTLIAKNYHSELNDLNLDVESETETETETLNLLIKVCCSNRPPLPPKITSIVAILESLYQKILRVEENVRWGDLDLERQPVDGGSFGVVFEAEWRTSNGRRQIAVKRITIINDTSIEREIQCLSILRHENVVKLFGTTRDNEMRTIIAMEFADCGSLHKFLRVDRRTVTLKGKLNWMLQCAKGVAYLHEQQPIILHRDLKPHNLLLFNDYQTLKICDFGCARFQTSKMTATVGTAPYMAPEVSMAKPYTEKCDVYSFGILCWEIMTQRRPFDHLENDATMAIINMAVQNVRPPIDDVEDGTGHIRGLIRRCWDQHQDERPTMKELVAVLSIDPNSYAATNTMIRLLQNISIEDFTG